MIQVDKALIVTPKGKIDPSDLLELNNNFEHSRNECLYSAEISDSESKNIRSLLLNFIECDEEFTSPSLIQMHIRRSSVVFVIIPNGSSEKYQKYATMLLPRICASYNDFSPCKGPIVTLHYIFFGNTLSTIKSCIEYSRRSSHRKPVPLRHSVIPQQAENTYDENEKAEINDCEILSSKTSILDIYLNNYGNKTSHWRRICSAGSEVDSNTSIEKLVYEAIDSYVKRGITIFSADDVYKYVSDQTARNGNDFIQYDCDAFIDILDKRGEIRFFELSGEIFSDVEKYDIVARHVLSRLGEISDERFLHAAVLDLDELVGEGIATDYLLHLNQDHRHRIVNAMLNELITSGVAHKGVFRNREYVVGKRAIPVNVMTGSECSHPNAIINILAGLKSENYRFPRARQLLVSDKNNLGIYLIPISENSDLRFFSFYTNGRARDIPMYFEAIRNPEMHKDIIREFWNSKGRMGAANLLANFASEIGRFFNVRHSIVSVNNIVREVASQQNINATIEWYCLDDILKPKKRDIIELLRTRCRRLAVWWACLDAPPPLHSIVSMDYLRMVKGVNDAQEYIRDLQKSNWP